MWAFRTRTGALLARMYWADGGIRIWYPTSEAGMSAAASIRAMIDQAAGKEPISYLPPAMVPFDPEIEGHFALWAYSLPDKMMLSSGQFVYIQHPVSLRGEAVQPVAQPVY